MLPTTFLASETVSHFIVMNKPLLVFLMIWEKDYGECWLVQLCQRGHVTLQICMW